MPGGLTLTTAATLRARLTGLTKLSRLPGDHALLLPRCRSVHTVGMRFALDLVWLGADGRVVRIDSDVRPRRIRSCRPARAVVEARAGTGRVWAAALEAAAVAQADGGSAAAGDGEPGAPPAERPARLGSPSGGG